LVPAIGCLPSSNPQGDPVWRLPLHASYRRMLDSKVADISSTGEPGQAGAITAALFLAEFTKVGWVGEVCECVRDVRVRVRVGGRGRGVGGRRHQGE
jgi:hypothetical protein